MPQAGGPLFMAIKYNPRTAKPICTNADTNAAINIGLRALGAPERLDIHHRFASEISEDGGLTLLSKRLQRVFPRPDVIEGQSSDAHRGRVTLFVDSEKTADFDWYTVFLSDGCPRTKLATGKGLWGGVKRRSWAICREINDRRLEKLASLTHVPLAV